MIHSILITDDLEIRGHLIPGRRSSLLPPPYSRDPQYHASGYSVLKFEIFEPYLIWQILLMRFDLLNPEVQFEGKCSNAGSDFCGNQ
jgi:hypothetical protein